MDLKKKELKHRAEARKKDLEARLERLRADGAEKSREAMSNIQHTLGEIEAATKSGWDNLTDATVERLNNLLEKDEKASSSKS